MPCFAIKAAQISQNPGQSYTAETVEAISTVADAATIRVIRTDGKLTTLRPICRLRKPCLSASKPIAVASGWVKAVVP